MERGRKKGTCVLLSSQQFVCMLERLLDSMTTHRTVKSTCTHGAVVCLAQKLKQSTLSKIGLTSSRHCADCHARHKPKIGTPCAMNRDYEHVTFLSC